MSAAETRAPAEPPLRLLLAALALVWLAIFIIALTGYPNLMDNERRIGAYVLDAVQNGHWIMQRDDTGELASKPPLLTWIAALVTLPFGHLTRFAIYLPSALAALGVAWLVLIIGRQKFGWLAGFLGAFVYLLSPIGESQAATARYDGLFSLPVALAAVAAFRAWNLGRGWTWFWTAATVATMVKGPLGVLLPATGLLAALWERRSGERSPIRGPHWLGVLIFLMVAGGWFVLAYREIGQPLIDKLIGRELIGHALKSRDRSGGFYEPSLNVVTHFLPWSIFALMGLWRVCKKPAMDRDERRFERFLFCWFLAGLVIFSLAAHQRGRLILPLMPAAALLAGRELARLLVRFPRPKLFRLAGGVAVFTLAIFFTFHHFLVARSRHVKQTQAMRELAAELNQTVGAEFPLTHLDTPFALQFYLNTVRPWVEPEQAAELLRGDAAAFVVVRDLADLEPFLKTNSTATHIVRQAPRSGNPFLRVVSNHSELEWTDRLATIIGPFSVRMTGVKLVQSRGDDFVFEAQAHQTGEVTLANTSKSPQKVRIRFVNKPVSERRTLAPGESWTL